MGRLIRATAGLACFLVALSSASGQDPKQRIYELPPFDQLTLDETNDNAVIKVRPLAFPGRQAPAKPKPSDKLKVKLLDDARDYEVAWFNIKKIDFFEDLIVAEAEQVARSGKLDEAYDYIDFLLNTYPQRAGVAELRNLYLYLSAGAAFRNRQFVEALAILEELHQIKADYRATATAPAVLQLIGACAEQILTQYLEKNDFRSSKLLLSRLIKTYNADQQPFAVKFRGQLTALATRKRDEARAHLAAGRFVEAYDAAAEMRDIWAEVEGGEAIAGEIAARYPLLRVGVTHPALEYDPRSLVNPAARRAGRLLTRQLLEFTGMGPEGGVYRSPIGVVQQSDDRSHLIFTARPPQPGAAGATANPQAATNPFAAPQIGGLLLRWADPADPAFVSGWARLLDQVRAESPTRLRIDLRIPHVLPEAFLQGALAPVAEQPTPAGGPYYRLSGDPAKMRFTRNSESPLAAEMPVAEFLERTYGDPQRMLLALQRQEVDLIDQVFPADIAELKRDPTLVVRPYSAPTTHLLAPRSKDPYVVNRTFRRALLYSIQREVILSQGLLRGEALPGWRVVSAPFPAPSASGDTVAYGYDEAALARPYDPRLGLMLRLLAQRQLKIAAEQKKEKTPELGELKLAHPADEVSRTACRAIIKQWELIGVKAKLIELPSGVFLNDEKTPCDFVYLQLAAWEPITDAARLFGPGGPAESDNGFIRLALRQVETAPNWVEARARLRELHRLIYEEVTVLPLWQTYDHYAFRKTLVGPEAPRAALYEDIERWNSAANVAQN